MTPCATTTRRPAMVERQEVEALLAACVPGSEAFVPAMDKMSRRKMRALCRAWLALQDAPEVDVKEALFSDGYRIGKIIATADASLIGQRVRIVKEARET